MTAFEYPDFTAMMHVVDNARVVDFMRFVNREMRERPELATLSFRDGWNVMVGAYATTYAEPYPVENGSGT